MTFDEFNEQWQRLINKFGPKNMDPELKELAAEVLQPMSYGGFKFAVDTWIGSRPYNRPPMMAEFREAAFTETKRKLDQQAVRGLQRAVEERKDGEGLARVLALNFPGAKSASEALELARRRQARDLIDPKKSEPEEGA